LRVLARWLLASGVVLIVPAALTFTPVLGPLTSDDDAAVAFTPIVRLPLDTLGSGSVVSLSYVVPDSAQWDRIRKNGSMGDHGYVAFVADTLHGKVLPFTPLGIDVSVSSRNSQIPVTHTDAGPYLYAPETHHDVGLRFSASPGDRLRITISARNAGGLPEGELIVQPYWEWSARDFAEVSRELDRVLRPVVARAAQAGMLLLVAGVALSVFSATFGRARSE